MISNGLSYFIGNKNQQQESDSGSVKLADTLEQHRLFPIMSVYDHIRTSQQSDRYFLKLYQRKPCLSVVSGHLLVDSIAY